MQANVLSRNFPEHIVYKISIIIQIISGSGQKLGYNITTKDHQKSRRWLGVASKTKR